MLITPPTSNNLQSLPSSLAALHSNHPSSLYATQAIDNCYRQCPHQPNKYLVTFAPPSSGTKPGTPTQKHSISAQHSTYQAEIRDQSFTPPHFQSVWPAERGINWLMSMTMSTSPRPSPSTSQRVNILGLDILISWAT